MKKDSEETSHFNKTFSLNQYGSIRIYAADEVRQILTMNEVIELMAIAFKGLSKINIISRCVMYLKYKENNYLFFSSLQGWGA